jgi:hypothetical protein
MEMKDLCMWERRNQKAIGIWHYMYGIYKPFINGKVKATACTSRRKGL